MVLIDDQKFACQSCIKGHRSSSCNHTDRPLFEIRKKGRPATQCDGCRDLRRTKKLHVRCACPGRKDPEAEVGPVQIQCSSSAITSRKVGRKIPIVPKLPHGVKDLEERTTVSSTKTALVQASLHPALATIDALSVTGRAALSDVAPTSSQAAPLVESMVGPVRSCCCRKPTKHSRTTSMQSIDGAVPPMASPITESGATHVSNLPALDFILPQSSSSTLSGSIPTSLTPSSLQVDSASVESDEEMACLCGPSCCCNGCTKHRPYAEADGRGTTDGCGVGCPPDCPSCVNNEDGFTWPSSSVQHPTSGHFTFRSSVGPQPSLSHARSHSGLPDPYFESISGLGMSEDWDDELDAEGSPDPAYIMLPDVSVKEVSKSTTSSSSKPVMVVNSARKDSQPGQLLLLREPHASHNTFSLLGNIDQGTML